MSDSRRAGRQDAPGSAGHVMVRVGSAALMLFGAIQMVLSIRLAALQWSRGDGRSFYVCVGMAVAYVVMFVCGTYTLSNSAVAGIVGTVLVGISAAFAVFMGDLIMIGAHAVVFVLVVLGLVGIVKSER